MVVGHFGINKTMELVFCDYWWPQLWKFVKEFVGYVCICAKNLPHCLHGLLQPLPFSISPWSSISMDFIMDFPWFNSFDSILMVVDHLTNMVHFIPYNKSITNEKTIKLFLDHVFCCHGFLENIVFDGELQFASKFCKWFFELLGVKVKLSLVFHPWIDGQME